MIERINENKVYNPIRNHIEMGFRFSEPNPDDANKDSSIILEIAKNIKEQKFNPEKSRVLIFAHTREKTKNSVELLKRELENLELPYCNKVDFYHAGLDGNDREEKYDKYQKGEIVILIATKAFGMGMDIKNIHHIYHLGPSSSFEDFLQEIGRAGRNKELLISAGFSEQNPIKTICFMNKDDFKRIKDRQHNNLITISGIQDVFESIIKYIGRFKTLESTLNIPFALPFDLLSQQSSFDNQDPTFFRLSLYWLERFKKIKIGMYAPAQFPIELINNDFENKTLSSKDEQVIKKMLIKAHQYKDVENKKNKTDLNEILVETNTITKWLSVKPSKIIFYLLKAQKMGFIRVKRNISLIPAKLRSKELENAYLFKALTLNAVFDLARELLNQSQLGNQVQIDNESLEQETKKIVSANFNKDSIYWTESERYEDLNEEHLKISKKLQDDFINKRSKFSLFIINSIPKINCKTNFIIEDDKLGEKVYNIYNGYSKHQEWKDYLNNFEVKCVNFIKHISNLYFQNDKKSFNILELMIALEIEDEKELQKIISIAKLLAYLKGNGGSITSMGVECAVNNSDKINLEDQTSEDYKVSLEFEESNKMRELRLLSLECLSLLKLEDQDSFIKQYFACGSQADLILLLEDKFGENHEYLQAFRAEALKLEEKKLNDEQKVVYEAPLNSNLQVIAGPGSGKTHTLTLRIARLVQNEKIAPENILILAYNRGVVVELKDRLGKLFKSLGYGKLINRLKIFTFHGFVKFILRNELDNIHFDEWINEFLTLATKSPGIITQKLGNIKYVFVDEFQDITAARMKLLKHVANPNQTKICVIGDPNQSIYGYERLKAGDLMNPQPFYAEFDEIYHPKTLYLKKNYRSYPLILDIAEQILNLNSSKFKDMPLLEPQKFPEENRTYCEIIDYEIEKNEWRDKLLEILQHQSNKKITFKQVAVMFRSNAEIFGAYNILQSVEFSNYKIRIEGSESSPFKSREFNHFIDIILKNGNNLLKNSFKDKFVDYKDTVKSKFPNWDSYLIDLFHCLVLEFFNDYDYQLTYSELYCFIEEISKKDDSHLSKIYKKRSKEFLEDDNKQEIVLTTIHKVKGLEFDAVLIPHSIAKLAINVNPDLINDFIEEERRLYYVAFTRAKYHLSIIESYREKALKKGETYQLPDNIQDKLGLLIKEGIDKFNISWGGSNFAENSFNIVHEQISIGDKVEIRKDINGVHTFFNVYYSNYQIGQINLDAMKKMSEFNKITGFRVSSIDVYTYKETEIYDQIHGTTFGNKWSEKSKNRGFIYLTDFSGYGKGK